jgi:serine/threonine protein kinase
MPNNTIIEDDVDPLDDLLDNMENMDSELLASRIIEACRGDDGRLIEHAFHVARSLPDNQRTRLLGRLNLNTKQRAVVDDMLALDRHQTRSQGHADHADRAHAMDATRNLHGVGNPTPSVGRRIDQRYDLLRRLGRGGMGDVYLARDRKLRREVAIKLLTQIGDTESVARFLREARVTAQCRHENIVAIHDVGEHRPAPDLNLVYPYMVLEYLEGQTLREYLREQRAEAGLQPDRVLDLIIPVVRALAYAHERAIIHRDLKPENIFITRSGMVVVLDFGIAKPLSWPLEHASTIGPTLALTEDVVDALQTREGIVMGTLPYMAPEQWMTGAPEDNGQGATNSSPRDASIDHRTDQWSVGILLYEMLAGRHPISARSIESLHAEICDLDRPMPRLADALAAASPCLAMPSLLAIVDRCLKKQKHERMSTAAELLAALKAARAEISPDPAPLTPGSARHQRRGPALRWLAAGLALAGGVTLLMARSPEQIPQVAPFPADVPGIVVASSEAEATDTYKGLCAAIEPHVPPDGLRCIQHPHLDDGLLLRQAAEAGATLLIRIDTAREARLIPMVEAGSPVLDRPIARPISEQPPTVRVATAEARVQAVRLALALSQLFFAAARSPTRGTAELPEPSAAEIGWRGAALVWVLRIANNDYAEKSISEARTVAQECADSVTVADWYCAAAHYAYSVYCDDCSDTGQVLKRLALDGHETFRGVARLAGARFACEQGEDPDAATAMLLEMAQAWNPADCRRWTLVDAASCVLLSNTAAVSMVRDLAFPERAAPTLGNCDNRDLIATALAARGRWHYRKADLAEAERDFARAQELDARNPAYPIRWAEAFMGMRGLRLNDAEKRRLREQLAPLPHAQAADRVLIAFLRWVGIRDESAASELDQMFAALPDNAPPLMSEHDPDGSLAEMACARFSPDERSSDPVVCDVYRLLVVTKTPDSRASLRAHLFARRE